MFTIYCLFHISFSLLILFLLQLWFYWNISSIILFSFNGQWNLFEPLSLSTWIYILNFSASTFQVDVLSILFSFWTSSGTQSRYLLGHCTESRVIFLYMGPFNAKKKKVPSAVYTHSVPGTHVFNQAQVIYYSQWKLAACSPDYRVNDASLQT